MREPPDKLDLDVLSRLVTGIRTGPKAWSGYDKGVTKPEVSEEARELYRQALLDEDLVQLRGEYARVVSDQLLNVAAWLGIDSLIGAGDQPDTNGPAIEPNPDRYAAFRGASAVVEMASELAAGAVAMLDADRRYAAAALVRQLIEAEYLLRAFVDDLDRAAEWYRSTPAEIRKAFMPKTMRPQGGFSDHEYWTHSDQGGHPSPQGRHLLRFGVHGPLEGDAFITASMWGDLAQHLRRVWHAVHDLLAAHHARFATVRSESINVVAALEARWMAEDPLAEPVDFGLLNALAAEAATHDDDERDEPPRT